MKWVVKSPRHSALCFTGRLTYPAYRYVPVAYIVCERDLVIPPAFQREWIDRMEEESGRSVRRLSLDTGHSPNASAPGDLVRLIEEAVGV
jgi:pimeloyl-ACP methyl ester carboxylesterase